jgi:hypothetical protein
LSGKRKVSGVAVVIAVVLVIFFQGQAHAGSWFLVSRSPDAGGYGEALVSADNMIYILRCRTATDAVRWWRYDPATDEWVSLSTSGIPAGLFRNGAALAWDGGDYIYALVGARYSDPNRTTFLRYSISSDSWEYLENTPGPQGAGDALAWCGWDGRVYAILGSNQHGTVFARYSPQTNGWEILANPPGGTDDGCSLCWTGGRYLYALRGEYNETSPIQDFWCYDIQTNSWSSKAPIPDSGGVGDGGSLLWIGNLVPGQADYIYALGGGECDESGGYGFFRYRISADSWEVLEDLPYPVGYYNGNRLGFASGYIFYWQGTPSTWEGGGNALCAYPISAPPPSQNPPPSSQNTPPVLESGRVSPSSGTVETVFTFEVVYRDADGDAPSFVRVNVSGTVYSMSRVSGTYAEGALYRTSTTLPKGYHTYYFEASDGKNTTRLPSVLYYFGPEVREKANSPPVLSSGFVYPASGREGTAFTFEVMYSDPDNDAPLSVGVYIDGIHHEMERVGENASGILYRYQTSELSVGHHEYYFVAVDNRWGEARLPSVGSYQGPTVEEPPRAVLVLVREENMPIAYTNVQYGFEEGKVVGYLGMTDSQGRIAVPENLVGKKIYLMCGGYRGSVMPSWGETKVVLAEKGVEAGGGNSVVGIALVGLIAAAVFGAYRFVRGRRAGWRAA